MSAGKGDRPRTVDAEIYGVNYDNIFRKGVKDPVEITPTEKENGSGTIQDNGRPITSQEVDGQ